MSNLVVCCDGTWNTPDQSEQGVPTPTNVVRLFNSLADQGAGGEPQLRYYHPGVGTDGSWWDRLAGGGMGIGLGRNVMSAYRWLAEHYRPGDRIFLFGFSRGAYTVRSLAGMITSPRCGLLRLDGLAEAEVWKRIERAYGKGYRDRKDRAAWAGDWEFHRADPGGAPVPVYLLGVWDTVGALGIPDDLAVLNLLDDPRRYAFHDTELNDLVLHARHAVALDECRLSYAPTLWSNIEHRPTVQQLWFPGVHSDVGGGYPETGLSDLALHWMMAEAEALGLGLLPQMMAQLRPDPRGVLHDSRRGLFQLLRAQPRSFPELSAANEGRRLHPATLARHRNPPITQAPYHPSLRLQPGESRELTIYAAEPWNATGLWLEAGERYAFSASGEWLDRNIKCGPGGTSDGKFQLAELAHLAGTLWGKVEGLFQRFSNNELADFKGTRRIENLPWFALVGAIGNGGHPTASGALSPCETIPIRTGIEDYRVGAAGYLYCFANDAWNFYDNNRGSVRLAVRRLS
jgi:hypothetical protein